MSRRRLGTVALVVLAVLALGATAASIDSIDPDSEDSGDPGSPTLTPVEPAEPPRGEGGPSIGCPSPLDQGVVFGGVVALLALAGAVAYRVRGSALLPVVAVPTLVVGLLALCPTMLSPVEPLLTAVAGLLTSRDVLVGALALALCGALALLYVTTDAESLFESGDVDAADAESDLAAVGRAAGDAADRIEGQADVSNEVYRAWVEMTDHLDVPNPESTAPDEFAEAAVDAGMAEDDVATLTRLFQDVRYGGEDPGARADEAVAALRGIERTYGGEDP